MCKRARSPEALRHSPAYADSKTVALSKNSTLGTVYQSSPIRKKKKKKKVPLSRESKSIAQQSGGGDVKSSPTSRSGVQIGF